ncbi:MAG: aldose 1-epimerase [Bacteroidetes bacterium]|nr:aldose 1-epimerase [Bacteroidota bacterium]
MYKIEHNTFGALTEIKIKNELSGEYVSIIPGFAATINGLVLNAGNKKYEVVDGCKSYDELMSEGKNKFKGTKLFPFPNRINKGEYLFEGKSYQLNVNFPNEGNAIHGLVCESAFEILSESNNNKEASVTLQYISNGKDKGYPFKYKLTVVYVLNDKGFSCKTIAENIDAVAIPIGDGWHPYFKLGGKVDELSVQIPSAQIVLVNDKMIPNGLTSESDQFTKSTKIANHQFDTCYKLEEKEGIQKVELINESEKIKLQVWQESGKNKYNFVQIYTPPSRDSIAVEPMTCMPDAFNNKHGLITLQPSEIVNFSFGVELTMK